MNKTMEDESNLEIEEEEEGEGEKMAEELDQETLGPVASHKTKSYGISIDSSRIRAVPVEEQSSVLRGLGIDVFNQEEFEEGVLQQVDEAIAAKEMEALVKSWEKQLKSVEEEIRTTIQEIDQTERILKGIEASEISSYESRRRAESVRRQHDNKLKQLKKLEATQKSLQNKIGLDGEEEEVEVEYDDKKCTVAEGHEKDTGQTSILQNRLQIMKEIEQEREKLIQTGQMTPFGGFVSVPGTSKAQDIYEDEADEVNDNNDDTNDICQSPVEVDSDEYIPDEQELRDSWYDNKPSSTRASIRKLSKPSLKKKQTIPSSNVRYTEDDAVEIKSKKTKKKVVDRFKSKAVDDGDDNLFRKRIRHERIQKLLKEQAKLDANAESDSEEEMPDMEFDNRMKIPGNIWHRLYAYQQTGVKWLWELHCQQAGGIVGDEMGLGKTIQVIAFLAGLKYSNIGSKKSRHSLGPVLIVCPVTVLQQWVAEFHKWSPEFRVAVLHDTGSYQGYKETLVRKICQANGVIVTSYSGVRMNADCLLAQRWDYVILDEGHKIRNPDAEITLICKQFRTPHRIILSGTPMQNNLRELWSLFDFVFPGKLGTLPVFMTEFSVPITTGGYANASSIQVQTAYKCACVLRDTINPYLLRRLKKDVKMSLDLPDKNEQVLFCRLTEEQRELYQEYLDSREVQSILAGNYKVFPGLIMLRKICNHPDLTSQAGSLIKAKQDKLKAEKGLLQPPDEDDGYGDWRRGGKMIVVEALLKLWKAQGHRVLLFSQTRQMLNILEMFVKSRGYSYRRMDGSTSVSSRQPLVNKFNQDPSIFVFLLTTRVGGIGVNLIGADRVIIYDPDWNPSTDTQARERSWRIGQLKKVTIYRLLTSGTIEEKIYHRQIFKQFLTNRVLKDPKQRRFFKTNDLFELFTLDESYKKQGTETSAIFAGTNCEINVRVKKKRKAVDPRESAQPLKKTRSIEKQKKKSKTTNKITTVQDDGGAFSIDARDIMEISSANRNASDKTNDAKDTSKTPIKNEETNEKEDSQDQKQLNTGVTKINTSEVDIKGIENQSRDLQDNVTGMMTAVINDGSSRDIGITCSARDNLPEEEMTLSKPINDATSRKSVPEVKWSKPVQGVMLTQPEQKGMSSKYIQEMTSRPSTSGVIGEKQKKTRKVKASSMSDKELRKQLRLKKEKKRRKKKGKIEGQIIDNLDYHEVFHDSSTTDLEDQEHNRGTQSEDLILKTLFKDGGVHSVLRHDVIMDSGNPDYTLVETEANRVAKQAVMALKKSRQKCLRASAGVPTWTGVSGLSGLAETAAKPRPKFGKRNTASASPKPPKKNKPDEPLFSGAVMGLRENKDSESDSVSSNQLLAKMRARNNILPDEEAGTSTEIAGTEHDGLLAEVTQFVLSGATVPGQATSQEIVERFKTQLPQENSSVFRAMLRRICDFSRGNDKRGVWKLKSEFF
ncbi:DNA excision repair protein ERCC-6-like [Actinia tenebrosa]|uniref:DNA excision repair protein ERCC-6 n=1 Tax=Actinia tenebrosa TaxID=6105 RepID=A0A6P8ID01_ACTTE|nr:DNA excision repair protein ERCC-6-like [Actinia tenebrosa]